MASQGAGNSEADFYNDPELTAGRGKRSWKIGLDP